MKYAPQAVILLCCSLLILTGCRTSGDVAVRNFHQVNSDMYRSSQPNRLQMKQLHEFYGIKSVVNLREYHSDRDEIGELPLKLYEVPIAAGKLSENDLKTVLLIIKDAPKPILVHCMHGSDRTGAVIAAYRIVYGNYPVEAAINELKEDRYGHHKQVYPNIERLLRSINWNELKNQIL